MYTRGLGAVIDTILTVYGLSYYLLRLLRLEYRAMKTISLKFRYSTCALMCSILLSCVTSTYMSAQKGPDPVFKKFKGKVVELPTDSIKVGYRPYIESLDPVDTVIWDHIMVRVRKTRKAFPDVKLNEAFGILFYNQMNIKKDGYYEFILASDDGSRLWIDGQQIIDNDLIHPMKVERDTIPLRKGVYPIKLWYYQAMHDKYGFIFQGKYDRPLEEETDISDDPIVWDGDILFEFDHHELSEDGLVLLDSLIELLDVYDRIEEITVMGHTDDLGPLSYNKRLSQLRATSIADYLSPHCERLGIKYQAVGYGEEQPRVPNSSPENRAKNRRVEFLIR